MLLCGIVLEDTNARSLTVKYDRLVLICLAVWSLLFGLFTLTNFRIEWGQPLMGLAALVLGVVCLIRVLR
jgi:hypothetical protein